MQQTSNFESLPLFSVSKQISVPFQTFYDITINNTGIIAVLLQNQLVLMNTNTNQNTKINVEKTNEVIKISLWKNGFVLMKNSNYFCITKEIECFSQKKNYFSIQFPLSQLIFELSSSFQFQDFDGGYKIGQIPQFNPDLELQQGTYSGLASISQPWIVCNRFGSSLKIINILTKQTLIFNLSFGFSNCYLIDHETMVYFQTKDQTTTLRIKHGKQNQSQQIITLLSKGWKVIGMSQNKVLALTDSLNQIILINYVTKQKRILNYKQELISPNLKYHLQYQMINKQLKIKISKEARNHKYLYIHLLQKSYLRKYYGSDLIKILIMKFL